MLRYLPNALTTLRLILALPLGALILQQEFAWALGVGFLAGLTDALDGYFARRLGVFSNFGAALDPIADKVLITVSFLTVAEVGLVPWYLAILVIARDLVIVAGAVCYHFLIAPIEFAATTLSKANMVVQIAFCVLVLSAALLPAIPAEAIFAAIVIVIAMAVISGMDYVLTWSSKARHNYDPRN